MAPADSFDPTGTDDGSLTLAPEAQAPDPMLQGGALDGALRTSPEFRVTAPPAPASDGTGPGPTPKPKPPAPVQGSTYVAAKRDPARWAQVMKLSQQWNVAPDFADRNFDQLSQAATKHATDQQAANVSPTFANWLSDPDNATLAQHELAPLATVDRSTSLLSGATDAIGTGTATGMADLASAAGQLAVAYGMASPSTAARFVADMNQRAQSLRAQAPAFVHEYETATSSAAAKLDQDVDALTAPADASAEPQTRSQRILTALSRAFSPEAGHTIGDAIDLVRAATIGNLRGLAYKGVESLASMAPMLGGAAAGSATGAAIGSVAGPVGTAIGGTIGGMTGTFAGMAPVNVGQEINAELTKRGVDNTDPAALVQAFTDPQVMADVRAKSERAGIATSLVQSLFAGFAGKLGEAASESNLATRAAAHAADVSVQAAGMGAGQAAGQAAKGEKVSVGQAIQTAITTLGVSAGMEAIGASRRAALHPDTAEAAADATTKADDALQAHQDAALLEQIGHAVKEAPTTAQVPDRLRDLVETAAGGGDASTVYFQNEDWNKYWLAHGESPADKAAAIIGDDGKAYTEAQATGAPLAIPLADYVAKLAPTDDYEGLLPAARMRPDGASLEDARSYLTDLPATLQGLAREATGSAAQSAEGEAGASAGRSEGAQRAAQVGADIQRQLVDAGRTPTEAKANAALWESAFRTLGERAGVDPLELYNRYGLTVRRGAADVSPAEGLASREQVIPGASAEVPAELRDEEETGRVRGRILFGDKATTIELTRLATRSTFIHETGHFWLKMLDELGTGDGAPPELAADRRTIRDWLGAGDDAFTRGQHEQFARAIEHYLGEGNAPSEALRGVFARFRRWVLGVYKDLRTLNVPMTDDVRGVFDRLLASHDELEAARRTANVEPLFGDPKAVGLSDDAAARYRSAVEEARQAAEDEMTARVMRQIRREESRDWKSLRAPIEAEVTKDVDAEPVYQARALMEQGTRPDGSPLPEGTAPVKLSKAAIVGAFGDPMLNALPRGVYATEGGIHPDVAAELLGFGSGRELLDALRAAPNRAAEIKARTDARMQQEHGERLTDEQVRDHASATVRNEKRAQLLRRELEILASDHLAQLKGLVRAVTRVVPSTDAVRAQAETIIGGKAVQDLKPHLYDVAAGKAARDAREALLKGDVERAFDAKRRELLNTELLRAAVKERDAIEGALDAFRKVFRRDERLADTRDMGLVNAARAILASFGIGRTDKLPSAYLEQLRKYDPDAYETIRTVVDAATTDAHDYKTLSIDEFKAMHQAVDGLWNLSRRTRQLEIDGRLIDREQAEEELTAQLAKHQQQGAEAGYHEAVSTLHKLKVTLLAWKGALRRVESWTSAIDLGDEHGPMRRYVFQPISEAATRFRVGKEEYLTKYAEIAKGLDGKLPDDKIPAPELGYTFKDKAELLGALLHRGNESNLQKLLRGRHWGEFDERGVLDASRWNAFEQRMQREGVLTKGDYDYAQAVWNLFEETKAGAQRAHRDAFGYYFEEVPAEPFHTPFGTYQGGYYPARVDPWVVSEANIHAQHESIMGTDNAFMFPSVQRGFTKSRVEQYARPLLLDARAVPTHIDAVLRFTHLGPTVRDVGRVIMSRSFRPALDALDPTVAGEMLVPWLQRAGQQQITVPAKSRAGRAVDVAARELRDRSSMQIMVANATVFLEQFTHFPSVMVRVGKGSMASAMWDYLRNPRDTGAAVMEKSDFMRTRESAAFTEAHKAIEDIMLDPSVFRRADRFLATHGNVLFRAVQSVMDSVTWAAGYREAVSKGASEVDAIRQADSTVREMLGSYSPEDISRFEAGGAVQRLFSMFYSFYGTKANAAATQLTKARVETNPAKRRAMLTNLYVWEIAIPALGGGIAKALMSGQQFDRDDDGPWDDVLRLFFNSQAHLAGRMVPFVGPAVDALSVAFSEAHRTGGDILSSPAVTTLEESLHAPGDVWQIMTGRRDVSRRDITDVLTAIGMATHLPARTLARPLGYLRDVEQGKAAPTGPADMARGLVTGR